MAAKDIEAHQFKKGVTGNPNGRPKKSFASINASLKGIGIKPLKKTELIEAYTLVFNSPAEELKKITDDPNTPYAFKLIVSELNNPKTRSNAFRDFRDYMFGKAMQSTDITTAGESLNNQLVSEIKIVLSEHSSSKK